MAVAITRLTVGRAQVSAANATVGRPFGRKLSHVLGLHSSECLETLRGDDDAAKMKERLNNSMTRSMLVVLSRNLLLLP